MPTSKPASPRSVLVIDVGGTHVKVLATGQKEPVKIDSGPTMTARRMVSAVRKATKGWACDAVAIGYPGPVLRGQPFAEPHNLAPGWVRFDYAKAFGCPVRVINDAAMQALGSYEGGRMLFLGLGTGLGTALIIDGVIEPMELAHLPYKNGRTYEDYIGERGLDRFGKKRWRAHVADIAQRLKLATQAEYVVLGGGNARLVKKFPPDCHAGSNENAFAGGFRLWSPSTVPTRRKAAK